MIMHEYHTYETYSFIADIGGYLVNKTTVVKKLIDFSNNLVLTGPVLGR